MEATAKSGFQEKEKKMVVERKTRLGLCLFCPKLNCRSRQKCVNQEQIEALKTQTVSKVLKGT